ncbi:transporter substrate-binding domain-containing protein [Enterovibrio makurazakiensis]|uniref:Transporter substrate-binding domain-containing protein n=1 Tax=Enterovibrio gelatinilyticus TaxID=2899819 RepID=A0ABT5R132_9GAMM|nr:transporter substrate-binding domain-containing protein [Enterovibrio sp. ZSDZ42]MDD1793974.1 transporter substrate-binding domain-containing protein [Enterovibrio sp. ZSDZ42]
MIGFTWTPFLNTQSIKLPILFSLLLTSFFAPLPAYAAAENQNQNQEITIVSEAWTDATHKDGSGLYFDIMREVFEPLGYKLNFLTTTYSRSVYLVQSKKMHAFLGSYIDEQENVLYPYWHFDAEQVAAVYKYTVIPEWQGEQSLHGKTVAWVKGYDYNEYMGTTVNIREVKSRRQGLTMLYSDRLDALIDARSEIEEEFEKGNIDRNAFIISNFIDLKLYPAFTNTPQGEELRRLYDEGFEELLHSGKLKTMFEDYEWDYFPF